MKNDKTLLIIGVSSDVGIALVRRVIDNYKFLIGQFRTDSEELQRLKQDCGDKLLLVKTDLSKKEDVESFVGLLAKGGYVVDHIVHLAAGKPRNLQFRKEDWNNVQRNIDVSVKSVYYLLKALLPAMVKQHYGKVVFMLTSYVTGFPPKYQSTYVVSKYALLGLMKSLAVEYIDYGITVNGVSPDMIQTKFLDELPHYVVEQSEAESIIKRNLSVDDVVPIFEFLLSDKSDVITGQNYEIRTKL